MIILFIVHIYPSHAQCGSMVSGSNVMYLVWYMVCMMPEPSMIIDGSVDCLGKELLIVMTEASAPPVLSLSFDELYRISQFCMTRLLYMSCPIILLCSAGLVSTVHIYMVWSSKQ